MSEKELLTAAEAAEKLRIDEKDIIEMGKRE